MADGEHEAVTGGKGIKDYLAVHAKAVAAGIGSLLTGEILLIVSDSTFTSQVQSLVPSPYAFLVPVVFSAVVYTITHQVPNKRQE